MRIKIHDGLTTKREQNWISFIILNMQYTVVMIYPEHI